MQESRQIEIVHDSGAGCGNIRPLTGLLMLPCIVYSSQSVRTRNRRLLIPPSRQPFTAGLWTLPFLKNSLELLDRLHLGKSSTYFSLSRKCLQAPLFAALWHWRCHFVIDMILDLALSPWAD